MSYYFLVAPQIYIYIKDSSLIDSYYWYVHEFAAYALSTECDSRITIEKRHRPVAVTLASLSATTIVSAIATDRLRIQNTPISTRIEDSTSSLCDISASCNAERNRSVTFAQTLCNRLRHCTNLKCVDQDADYRTEPAYAVDCDCARQPW